MFAKEVCFRLFVPAAALVVKDTKHKEKSDGSEDIQICRPSELPIYSGTEKESKILTANESQLSELPGASAIESFFGTIRKSVVLACNEIDTIKSKSDEFITDTQNNFDWAIKYLQEEDNANAKYGAIAIGGLAGYILGLRGRFFRRTLFASAGALGMASVCYPKEAAQYSELAVEEGRKYATIAYNFIYGVKKDDPPRELPSLPKIPTSFSEAWDAAAGVGKSVTSLFSEQTDDETPEKK